MIRLLGLAINVIMFLFVAGMILSFVGGAVSVVAGVLGFGDDAPEPSVAAAASAPDPDPLAAFLATRVGGRVSLRPMSHHGVPDRARTGPPPAVEFVCGVIDGDRIEQRRWCGRADVMGLAIREASSGYATDCLSVDDSYSIGPRWYACWFASDPDLKIPRRTTTSNPFREGG